VADYVLTTPVLDELERLPLLLADMEGQELRPAVWLVVDDGSTDGSAEWLAEQAAARDWMEVRGAPEAATEYLGAHVARVKRWGLEQALELARGRGVEPLAAGVVDADLRLPTDHYLRLVEALKQDPGLGVVSSIIRVEGEQAGRERFQREDLPRGGTQTFRVACLDAIGGLPPYPGFDGVANVKAKLRGWRCRLLTDLVAMHGRATATRFGVGPGYARRGRYAWFLGLNPLLVLARTAGYAASPPRSASVHFLKGWLGSAVRRAPRCPEDEVRRYYARERPMEYLRALAGRGPRFASSRRD
jgi:glycosyltransferase involved in cell wall biosynthesis